MPEISKKQYYHILSLLRGETEAFEDRRERRIIVNRYLSELKKADIDELTKEEAERLIIWLEAVC